MEYEEIKRLAQEHANRVAPKPKYDPILVGFLCAVGCYFALRIFTALADMESDRFLWPILITIGLAFFVPFAYVRRQESRHFEALTLESIRLSRASKSDS
jgi:hypothetical protein